MKRILALCLAAVILFCFVSCGAEPEPEPATPIEELTEDETLLFEALKKMSEDFYEPAGVKLLEVGEDGIYKSYSYPGWPEIGNGEFNSVVVRLQGENRVGGTLNHYYIVRLDTLPESIVDDVEEASQVAAENDCKEEWDKSSSSEYPRDSFSSRSEYKKWLLEYYYPKYLCTQEEATMQFGNHYELSDNYEIKDSAEDRYNIAKINKALKYYWDERLGNN